MNSEKIVLANEQKNNDSMPKTNELPLSWSIGIYKGKSPFELQPINGQLYPTLSSKHITDIPTSFVADPFMIQVKGVWYMFIEIKNSARREGEIGLATSTNGVDWAYDKIVLKEHFHLSYPYVFEWEEEFYMVPETLGPESIRLYKARNFPYDWEHITDLASGLYADPTLFRHEGKWWMFAASNPFASDTLNLFYADDLMGPFTEHPQSPLIEGNKHIARPAGRVIYYKNRLIRFCQDCLPRYGTSVRAFEITKLTVEEYKDQELKTSPVITASGKGWNGRGMHQIDAHQIGPEEWIACVDGYYSDETV